MIFVQDLTPSKYYILKLVLPAAPDNKKLQKACIAKVFFFDIYSMYCMVNISILAYSHIYFQPTSYG